MELNQVTMPTSLIIHKNMLSRLCKQAEDSERLRCNKNLHPQLSDPVQRFCNALQLGTYVQPHRHIGDDRWELFVILQGEVGILIFDDVGQVCERVILSAEGENRVIEIPPARWHSLFALKADSVLFEIKPGPYQQLSDKDFAAWAPQEGDNATEEFLRWYQQASVGELPPSFG